MQRSCRWANLATVASLLASGPFARGEEPRALGADLVHRGWQSAQSVPDITHLILFDLSGDGRDELFLTHAQQCHEDGSCPWFVYSPLATKGRVLYLGELVFDPGRYRLVANPPSICACRDAWNEQCCSVDFDELGCTPFTECRQKTRAPGPGLGAAGIHLTATSPWWKTSEREVWLEGSEKSTHSDRVPNIAELTVSEEPDSAMIEALAAKLESKDTYRDGAFRHLRKLGRRAAPAIPSLLCLIEEEIEDILLPHGEGSHLWEATNTLSAIGPDIIPPILAALDSPCDCPVGRKSGGTPCHLPDLNSWVCDRARFQLAKALSGLDVTIVPQLVRAFGDPGLRRPYLAAALGGFGEGAVVAVPVLVGALKATEPRLRLYCVEALGDIGPGAKEALPQLRALLRDPDSEVQVAASRAVQAIEAGRQ
jgi:hypothetical protein